MIYFVPKVVSHFPGVDPAPGGIRSCTNENTVHLFMLDFWRASNDRVWSDLNTDKHTHHWRESASCAYILLQCDCTFGHANTDTHPLLVQTHADHVYWHVYYTRLWFHLQSESRLSFCCERSSRSAWLGAALWAPCGRVGHHIIIIWVYFVPAPSLFLFLLLFFFPSFSGIWFMRRLRLRDIFCSISLWLL